MPKPFAAAVKASEPNRGRQIMRRRLVETYRKRGLAAPMTRSHFTKFLAEHTFVKRRESPADAELLDLTVSGGRTI